jgi:hypothetical protein
MSSTAVGSEGSIFVTTVDRGVVPAYAGSLTLLSPKLRPDHCEPGRGQSVAPIASDFDRPTNRLFDAIEAGEVIVRVSHGSVHVRPPLFRRPHDGLERDFSKNEA